jgi:hypothetical protein
MRDVLQAGPSIKFQFTGKPRISRDIMAEIDEEQSILKQF